LKVVKAMHFEFLLEDQSSEKAMNVIIPKILGDGVTYNIHSYKGIGRIPKGMTPKTDAKKRILLDRLPALLRGYGHSSGFDAIILICDLDNRDKSAFLTELNDVLDSCNPKPNALFCIAVEEFEAWYLGDLRAIQNAYPAANINILRSYENDSICGTWELLADAIYKGGHKLLKNKGWHAVGLQKSIWAREISPHMSVNNNLSPSFNHMYNQLKHMLRT